MYVDVADVTDAYEGTLTPEQTSWVQSKIDSTEIRLASFIGPLNLADPDKVREVIVGAVLRVIRDPTGMRTESDGDYSYGRDPLVASGRIWFPDDDLALFGIGVSTPGTAWLNVPWRDERSYW